MSLLHKTNSFRHRFHLTKHSARMRSTLVRFFTALFPFQPKLPTGLYQFYSLTATKVSRLCACAQSVFHVITKVYFDWSLPVVHFDCSNEGIGGPNSRSKSFALTWKIPRPTLSDFSKSNHFFSSVAKWGIYFGSELLSLAVRAKVQHAQTVHLHGLLPKQLAFQQQSRPISSPENLSEILYLITQYYFP